MVENGPRIRGASLCLALCVAAGAAQVERRQPDIVTLSPTSAKSLNVPRFGWYGNAQCDAAGNLYVHATKRVNDNVVLKLPPDGSFSVYTVSADDAADTWYLAFRVQPDGKLWLLAHGNKRGVFLFGFGENATVSPTRTRLDVPDDVDVRNFSVLQNGRVLLLGFHGQEAPKERRGLSYFAEFEASGRLVRSSDAKPEPADVATNLLTQAADAPAAQGEDGSIYMLAGYEIVAISQAGEIVRRFPVKSADPAYTPASLYLAAGRLAVEYLNPGSQPKGPDKVATKANTRYALFDPSNGEQLGVYEPGSELGNNMVCYSSEGFIFYRVKDGRVQLITAKP